MTTEEQRAILMIWYANNLIDSPDEWPFTIRDIKEMSMEEKQRLKNLLDNLEPSPL